MSAVLLLCFFCAYAWDGLGALSMFVRIGGVATRAGSKVTFLRGSGLRLYQKL